MLSFLPDLVFLDLVEELLTSSQKLVHDKPLKMILSN